MVAKVAIVTLPGMFNYGNLLQKYAVQSVLRSRGLEPTTLEFRDVSLKKRAKQFVGMHMLGREADPSSRLTLKRREHFEEFTSKINLRDVTHITPKTVGGFNWYVTGSDQVWNPNYLDRFRSTFLPFAPPEHRIALSASFGIAELPKKSRAEYAHALSDFRGISVREDAGADIVESLIGVRSPVLCDPTLMLRRSQWEHLANDMLNPSSPYVFTYLLGVGNSWQDGLSDSLATHYAAKVICMSDRDHVEQLPAGPAEFIALIAGARHVVTDSFHCALFATLFERPLTIVHRAGDGSSMFSRLETLSIKLGLEGKIVEPGGEPDLNAAADYTNLAGNLAVERAVFDAYLDDVLNVSAGGDY